ncbi:MAG: hypothetical protein IJE59_01025 [Clostridia bacterium]|nr:hypothetical protein [Clostridia bacterium]
MKKLKSQNGAITMLVLISIMFLISFLISTYVLVMHKAQSQKEIVEETKKIYESPFTMEEIYNSYFNSGNIVPIYTVEQLLYMGTGKQNVNINGKYYNFNNDENTIYVLMNDLEFNAYQEYGEDYYWEPIGNREDLSAKFEGNNYVIEVNYKEYTKVYSKDNEFSEYEILIINPVPEDATVTISSNGEVIATGKGRQKVLVETGANLEYSVERTYYEPQSGSATVDSTIVLTVELESKPEQTLTLIPASAEAEDWSAVNQAVADIDSSDYAFSWNTDKFYLHFDVSEFNENVKVTNILASYKLNQTISKNDVVVILNAGDVECINTVVEDLSTKLGGTVYETVADTLPLGTDVKNGLTLSINNVDGGSDLLYIYGARLTITYIEP